MQLTAKFTEQQGKARRESYGCKLRYPACEAVIEPQTGLASGSASMGQRKVRSHPKVGVQGKAKRRKSG